MASVTAPYDISEINRTLRAYVLDDDGESIKREIESISKNEQLLRITKSFRLIEEATFHNKLFALQTLITLGFSVDEKRDFWCTASEKLYRDATPLFIAVSRGRIQAVKVLLESNCDVNAKSDNGLTSLMLAATIGDALCFDFLVTRADIAINAKDDKGMTALMHACKSGEIDMVSRLIALGCNIDSRDRRGNTALHYAARGYKVQAQDIIVLLLKNGARFYANDRAESPAHIACVRLPTSAVNTFVLNGAEESELQLRFLSCAALISVPTRLCLPDQLDKFRQICCRLLYEEAGQELWMTINQKPLRRLSSIIVNAFFLDQHLTLKYYQHFTELQLRALALISLEAFYGTSSLYCFHAVRSIVTHMLLTEMQSQFTIALIEAIISDLSVNALTLGKHFWKYECVLDRFVCCLRYNVENSSSVEEILGVINRITDLANMVSQSPKIVCSEIFFRRILKCVDALIWMSPSVTEYRLFECALRKISECCQKRGLNQCAFYASHTLETRVAVYRDMQNILLQQ